MAAECQDFLDLFLNAFAIQVFEDLIKGFVPEQKCGYATLSVFINCVILLLFTDDNAQVDEVVNAPGGQNREQVACGY